MVHVLNISSTGQVLLENLRTNVGNIARENGPIVQERIDDPSLPTEQCNKAMNVVVQDMWNLACW